MSRGTILVVEDEYLIAVSLERAFDKAGFEVVGLCRSGEQAVARALRDDCPDLVLMDIRLAGALDGVEAALRIRQRCASPIVFHSAHVDAGLEARIAAVPGPVESLPKPASDERLIAVADHLLAARRPPSG